jgi:integrase
MIRLSRREPVSTEDIRQLLVECRRDESVRGKRDAAIVYLLAFYGLRLSRVFALNSSDVEQDRIRIGKAMFPLPQDGAEILAAWRRARGARSGPLFLAIQGKATLLSRRLSRPSMNLVFHRRCVAAGLLRS